MQMFELWQNKMSFFNDSQQNLNFSPNLQESGNTIDSNALCLTDLKTKPQRTYILLHHNLLLKEKFFETRTSSKNLMSNHKLQISVTRHMGNNAFDAPVLITHQYHC